MIEDYKLLINKKHFSQERSLYNLRDCKITNCDFSGDEDGESPLKEARNIQVFDSSFSLRYPLWHVIKFELNNINFDSLSRAPIWYAKNGIIKKTVISSIKCLRDCENIEVIDTQINSDEAIWKSKDIKLLDSIIVGDYQFLDSKDIIIKNSKLIGKYGLQYMKNVFIENSILDTKDAFWHCENVVVKNSKINGAYLAWYSKDLTLINCEISGTQPFCYCDNLKLINCKMIDCDLSFEYSNVSAEVIGNITSIKNPKSGVIKADSIEEIIMSDSIFESNIEIIQKI